MYVRLPRSSLSRHQQLHLSGRVDKYIPGLNEQVEQGFVVRTPGFVHQL